MNTDQNQPTAGALRAAIKCMRLSGRIQGDVPDELLAQWGAVQDMALVIDVETGLRELVDRNTPSELSCTALAAMGI